MEFFSTNSSAVLRTLGCHLFPAGSGEELSLGPAQFSRINRLVLVPAAALHSMELRGSGPNRGA
jgi:hypothetical protein